jgi:hypothetical protein
MTEVREFSSFRDPAGFLYWRDGQIFRHVDASYGAQYSRARESGLFEAATDKGLLLPFEDLGAPGDDARCLTVLRPELLEFVSYPYEWCFEQLKDAALLSLDLHLEALAHDMLLKDASAFNVHFQRGKPVFIDHLSFDLVESFGYWPAYGQFCRHFLAPLALMSFVDADLSRLLRLHIDGIPLDLASDLLPWRSRLSFGMQAHLHLHARYVNRYKDTTAVADVKSESGGRKHMSPAAMRNLAQSLRGLIAGLKRNRKRTAWDDYYADTNYNDAAMSHKRALVTELAAETSAQTIWDLGGNNGAMSRAILEQVPGTKVVCLDVDEPAVDANYRRCKADAEARIHPMVYDIANPSPDLGFALGERRALGARGTPDLIVALALMHHLVFTNNVPLPYLADFFAGLSRFLLIEFVPMADSQVQRLIANKDNVAFEYSEALFTDAFAEKFEILRQVPIDNSERTLYLMKSRATPA